MIFFTSYPLRVTAYLYNIMGIKTLLSGSELMSSSQNLGWNALADIFTMMEPQCAHWYSMKEPIEGEAYC